MVRAEEVVAANVTAYVASVAANPESILCCCFILADCMRFCDDVNCCGDCCGCCDPDSFLEESSSCGRDGVDLHRRPCSRVKSAFMQKFSDAELAAPIQLRIEDWAKQGAGGGALLEGEQVAHMRSNFSFFFQNARAERLKEWGLDLLSWKLSTNATEMRTCINKTADAVQRLVPEEEPGRVKAMFKEKPELFAHNVLNATARLVAAYAPFIAQHGLDLTSRGLPDFSSCGRLACDGHLQYKLTAGGLHECAWQCPAGHRPDKFRMLQAATMAAVSEAERKKIEEEMRKAGQLKQFASITSFVTGTPYKWAQAFSDAPLRLWQQADLYTAVGTVATALRYEGACRTKALMVGDRVKRISDGEVGKVTRLSGTYGLLLFKTTIPEGSVEVEYKSGTIVQFVSALSVPDDEVSVPVPRDYAAWAIASHASALALDIPVLAQVPTDANMMIWASAPPPKAVEEPPLQKVIVIDDPAVIKEQLQKIAANTEGGKPELLQRDVVAVSVMRHGTMHREKLD